LFKKITIALSLCSAIYANSDHNKTKELENWLRFGFTNGDISFIVEYIQKIEKDNYYLQKRLGNVEKSLLEQNKIIKALLLNAKDKKTEPKTAEKTEPKKQKIVHKKAKPPKKTETKKPIQIEPTYTKPTIYKALSNCIIYDKPFGDEIIELKEDLLFTSNIMYEEWIKATGYFPKGKWQKIKDSWWLKKECVKKR